MELAERIATGITPYLWSWSFAFLFLTALEMLSATDRHSLRSRLPGAIFWAIWLPVTTLVYAGFQALWARLGIQPLLILPLDFGWTGAFAVLIAPIAAAAVYDFFFYWCHRAQHAFLWRFHAVHHSIRDLNAVNSFHHITEPLVQTVLILLPTSLIVSDTGGMTSSILVVVLHLHVYFIHSNTRFHFGAGRVFFVDNRFHRIHHSLEERHFDRNFGAFTTLWDRLFGTAHFPASEEWPDCGLAEADQPRTLAAWLTLPYRLRRPAGDVEATADALPALQAPVAACVPESA